VYLTTLNHLILVVYYVMNKKLNRNVRLEDKSST